jgi:hypothetical protein
MMENIKFNRLNLSGNHCIKYRGSNFNLTNLLCPAVISLSKTVHTAIQFINSHTVLKH